MGSRARYLDVSENSNSNATLFGVGLPASIGDMPTLFGVELKGAFVYDTGGVDFLLSPGRMSIPAIVFWVGHE